MDFIHQSGVFFNQTFFFLELFLRFFSFPIFNLLMRLITAIAAPAKICWP
jgi:hypothetical protein